MYTDKFKDETIEMDDFTVMIKNLPKDSYFNHDENILKVRLWDLIQNRLNDEAKEKGMELSEELTIADISFASSKTFEL